MNLFKKIFIPTGQKKSVDGLCSWTVRWCSYRMSYSIANMIDQAEVFTNYEDAVDFKKQLEEAFKFTKSSVTEITITENKQL